MARIDGQVYGKGMLSRTLLACTLAIAVPAPARALCIYNGIDNAKTTIKQEFKDSRWVVRAHVVSADYHWSDLGESWTLYRLRVIHSFKGQLPSPFTFFTTRDSGGFYMDGEGASPDMDRDYLLFLLPVSYRKSWPRRAASALWENYNCGQSKPWTEVSASDALELASISKKH